jgi:hypothetical protein
MMDMEPEQDEGDGGDDYIGCLDMSSNATNTYRVEKKEGKGV